MKARVATIISIGGVLFAGTAAALVNTEVLGGSGDSGVATVPAGPTVIPAPTTPPAPPSPTAVTTPSTGAAVTTGSTPTTGVAVTTGSTSPAPTSPTTGSAVTTASTPTSTPTTATDPGTAPSADRATYQAGAAGTITLATSGGSLTIAGVSPAAGWFVERQDQEGVASIEVRFESADGEVRFEASLVRGVIVTGIDERMDEDDSRGRGSDD